MRAPRRFGVVGLALALGLLTGACGVRGPVGDKAGGVPGGKAVLAMAVASSQLQERPASEYFVRRLAELSGGDVRIDARYQWGSFAPDSEQQIVKAVASGTVDLGVVGSRVFDTMGVDAFQALTAPMLIDSYPLADAVIRSDLPGEMLPSLHALDVGGLAIMMAGIRRPIAVAKPLLGPADWRGIAFGDYLSAGQAEAIRALGASPRVAFGPLRGQLLDAGELTGFEFNLLGYRLNTMWTQARFITANVDLWPQMDVLIVNPDRLASLSLQQRAWLEQAAREAADRSAALMASEVGVVPFLCRQGTRFATAGPADLAWLRRTLASVDTQLERDRQTRAFIRRIQAMKRATPPGPAPVIPNGCSARAGAQG
jgi:TRAP-type C4-dicarboxylate transport system substrate-binding protein